MQLFGWEREQYNIKEDKMVKEVTFSHLVLTLNSTYHRNLLKFIQKKQYPISVRTEIIAGNSYDTRTVSLPDKQLGNESQIICNFDGQFKVLMEDGQKSAELNISFYHQNSRISTSSTLIQINIDKKQTAFSVADASSEAIGLISMIWAITPKGDLPFISMKNITCELRNSISSPQISRFLDVQIGGKRFKNKGVHAPLYWERPFKFFIENGQNLNWGLIEQNTGQRISISSQKIDSFTLMQGFKRVFIFDELQMPRGCIQLHYTSRGLRSQEEYKRQAQIEQNNQKQILKLTIKTIKGKLKAASSNISVRAFSGINFIKTQQMIEESNELLFTVNRYLYLESKETRCNFIVQSNEEIIGFGSLKLNMIGFFQRKIGIVSPTTKKEVGYLMVSIFSQKHQANSLQLAQLKLNLGKEIIDRPSCFISFTIKGCYTRTELQRIEGKSIKFRRFILMKYTDQEDLDVTITDCSNHELLKKKFKIQEMKSCGDAVLCKKTLTIRQENECALQLACIYGDLNKINVTQQLKKIEFAQNHLKSNKRQTRVSLLQQKQGRQAQIKQFRTNLVQEFKQFQESLANHIKSHNKSQRKNLNKSIEKTTKDIKSKSLAQSQKQKPFKIIYTSRPLNNSQSNKSQQKSQLPRLELPQLKVKGSTNVITHFKPFQTCRNSHNYHLLRR